MKGSFVQAFRRFSKDAGATPVGGLIAALLYAAAALGLTWAMPKFLPSVAGLFPSFFFDGVAGTLYVYTVLVLFVMLLYRICFGKLFTYANVTDGSCFFSVGCGANPFAILLAKMLSGLFYGVAVYSLGAGIVRLLCPVLGIDMSSAALARSVFLIGFSIVLAVNALQLLCGAIGGGRGIVAMVGAAALFMLVAFLYIKGALALTEPTKLTEALHRLGGLTGLFLPAAGVALLALVLSLLVPKGKLKKYEVEDLDDEMLRQLRFDKDLEVYEKQEDEYELLFAGKDVLGE